jgi:hypothetical protein
MSLDIILHHLQTEYIAALLQLRRRAPTGRPAVYYNMLLVNKEFNSRMKQLDIWIPMIILRLTANRQHNRLFLRMIIQQLNMTTILLPIKPSYNRYEPLIITVSEIKDNYKKREPRNPTNPEIISNIYSFIEDNYMPAYAVAVVPATARCSGSRAGRGLFINLIYSYPKFIN